MHERDELLEEHAVIHIALSAGEIESLCDTSTAEDQEVCFKDFA